MAKAPSWSKAQTEIFLSVLQRTGNVSAATRAARVTRSSAYEMRQRDEVFKKCWSSALEESLDDLEAELRRRAIEGTDKPVFYAGKQVGDIKSYSDALGMFLLRSRRKNVFGENNGDNTPVEIEAVTVRQKLLLKLEAIESNNN